jgi:hypothetical protein
MKDEQVITFHQVIKKPRRWRHPTLHREFNTRGYVSGRANIFAISGGAETRPWGPKHWVVLKLHSCLTWKYPLLSIPGAHASTEVVCGREEAEMMVMALMAGITEFDRQVAEREAEEKATAAIIESVVNDTLALST